MVQWLRLHAANAGGTGSIPGGGTKIPHAAWCGQKVKKKKSREGLREQIYGCWAESGEGRKDSQRVWDGHAHTAIFKWITNKDLLYSTGNPAHCDVAAWTGGEFGGEWIHLYAWLSPFAAHLKLSQHCSLAIPQYKIKS